MEVELLEIQHFLSQYPPFNLLPEEAIKEAAQSVEISYYRAETMVIGFGDEIKDLYMVRSGIIEVYRRNGELYNRLDEGSIFGQMGLLMNNKVRFPAKALKDSLLYCIPEAVFDDFCERYDEFSDFVEVEDATRLKQAVENTEDDANDLTTSKVKTLITREAVMIEKIKPFNLLQKPWLKKTYQRY